MQVFAIAPALIKGFAYVPITAGCDVLLSPADPDGFLRALATLRR
jgi:hypothetical protein